MRDEEDQLASSPSVLDHIAIAVEDLEEAIKTYCGALGLTVVERRCTTGRSTGMVSAVLTGAGIPLVLVQGTEPESQVTRFVQRHGSGVQHLAFAVADLAEGIERFARQGCRPSFPPLAGDGIRQVFLDKNGAGPRLELIERNGGDFNDESVQALFEAMEQRDLM